ncbi:MAG: glycosyltransferase [Candidatus Aenigmatarchaeota archaeon]
MNRVKISFLITALNEEKTIGKVLDNLARLKKVEPNIEVLAAIDGSTDRTEEIMKRYRFVKILIRGPRRGKDVSVHKLTQAAKGGILVIHDSDWIFRWNKKSIKKMIKFFKENPDVGGYVQSFFNRREDYLNDPAPFTVKIGFIGESVASNLIRGFARKHHEKCKRLEDLIFTPLVFIMRGGIISKKTRLNKKEIGDEMKRTHEIMKKGYRIVYTDTELPYFEILYKKTSFNDLVSQRTRGFLLNSFQPKIYGWNVTKYYFLIVTHFIKNYFKLSPIEMIGLDVWILSAMISYIKVKTGLVKDKKPWSYRVKRR